MPTITRFEEIEAWQTADLNYFSQEQFSKLLAMAEKASCQIATFISYFETHSQSQKVRENLAENEV